MPDNPKLIENYELELWNTIYRMHKDNISYEVTYHILQEMVKSLDLMSYCEAWLSQYAPEKPKKAPEKS